MSYPFECVHTFEYGGRHFVYDGNKMLLASVSPPLLEAVEMATQLDSESSVSERLVRRQGPMGASRSLRGLSRLSAAGFFQPDSEERLKSSRAHKSQFPAEARLERLILLVSAACNLDCVYCYASRGTFDKGLRGFQTLEMAEAAVRLFLGSSGPRVQIQLLGGEPLLHPDLTRLLDRIRGMAETAGVEMALAVSTNGTVISEAILRSLREHEVRVAVSVDGPATHHDKQRPFADGSPSYQTVMDNVSRFREALGANSVSLTVTCTSASLPELPEFIGQIQTDHEEIQLNLAPVIPGAGSACALWSGCHQGVARLERRLFEMAAAGGRPVPLMQGRRADQIRRRSRVFWGCEFAMCAIAVSVDGAIYPCPVLVGNENHRLGDVTTGLARPPRVMDLYRRSSVEESAQCRSCWAKYTCGGGCIAVNQSLTGDPLRSPDDWCDMYRISTETGLLAFIQEGSDRSS